MCYFWSPNTKLTPIVIFLVNNFIRYVSLQFLCQSAFFQVVVNFENVQMVDVQIVHEVVNSLNFLDKTWTR